MASAETKALQIPPSCTSSISRAACRKIAGAIDLTAGTGTGVRWESLATQEHGTLQQSPPTSQTYT
ncbi:hypothetical protein IAQ61_005294, partial [Plenodomus lingam]|uniref:Uncharacterized protein n=1 Tax=Leptosphaeria maculans (strain JN3 / isolate v23.1.3 / race Av1-4-5-6-7-8) TaxID=985895 RepID=E5A757_LEPMJ